jgi:uncharacterized protein (TIGR03382 family)
MSWITGILDTLSDLPTPVVLLAAAAFGIAESGLGVGIVIPGETVVLVLGAAMDNPVALVSLFLVVGLANWSALYVFAGALAGASVERIETVIGNTGTVILVVLVVLVLVVFLLRRRRAGAVRSAAAPLVSRSTTPAHSDEVGADGGPQAGGKRG